MRTHRFLSIAFGRVDSVVAVLVALTLFVVSCFGTVKATPQGIQCPTASVQTVKVAIRDCCDRIVGYEVRKPKLGEKFFVQCRCSEKKDATRTAVLTNKIEFYLPAPVTELATPARLDETWAECPFDPTLFQVSIPPFVRPPANA